ncbi:MAG: class II aldolase/adducin family protein [Negativicutes bacterium]
MYLWGCDPRWQGSHGRILSSRTSRIDPADCRRAAHAQNAVYLAKHGIISFAKDLGRACDIAEEFEQNAKIYVLTAGKIPLLSEEEVADVLGGKK